MYDVALIALEAGEIVLGHYGLEDFDVKADASPLTKADLQSHIFLTNRLEKTYPVCSEEAVLDYAVRKDLEYFWLIDPLDGTKDFLAQNGGFTINIALIHKNRPILGVVYAPVFSKLYCALKGFGSFTFGVESLMDAKRHGGIHQEYLARNKQILRGNRVIQDAQIIACDSLFHSTQKTRDFLNRYGLKVQKYGSSLKVCALAEGIADIYPRFNGTNEWDIAACDIVLEESGGVVLDCQSKQPLLYNKENFRNNYFIAFAKTQVGGSIYQDCLLEDFYR